MGLVRLALRDEPRLTPLYVNYQAFLLDREAARCTAKTLAHYSYTLGSFVSWLQERGLESPQQITPHHIRGYLVGLQRRGLKDTTQHAHARGIKTWLRWLVNEGELEDSPMRKVSMPRLEQRVAPPFKGDEVRALLAARNSKSPTPMRDRAMILALLDSGLRASDFVSLAVSSLDVGSGLVTVLGKGRKQRTVRFGAQTRKAVLRYLGSREDVAPDSPLWVAYRKGGSERGRLTLRGLEIALRRLGEKAGVTPCHPHKFRRTFALWCLREGMDLHSLRLLMGHSSLAVLQRYLALAGEDIERAHKLHSPVDNLLYSSPRRSKGAIGADAGPVKLRDG
jgi:site-specific recombinase XerD